MKRLAIVSTHPIQYNAPLFRLLAQSPNAAIHVFYSKSEGETRFDVEFKQDVIWDIPLTEGYPHSFVPCHRKPGQRKLCQSIKSFAPHAILVFGWNPPGHLFCMRHFHGTIPIWFRGDSIVNSGLQGWKRRLRKVALNWVYRYVDHAFYVGTKNKDYFLWTGMKEQDLTLAPHAVDEDFFIRDDEARQKEANAIRNELRIPHSDTVLLFAGKLNQNKQPFELAQAVNSLSGDINQRTHLIFVGSGPLESTLRATFDAHPHIHFAGFQNQSRMPTWYRVADILCLVSTSETWGLAVNEALICGCRVLASDSVGCVPDLVVGREGSHTVPHDKPETWTNTIAAMVQNSHTKADLPIPQLKSVANPMLNQLCHETS